KLLEKKKVLTYADFTQTGEADIEDMFSQDFYLRLVNEEYKAQLPKKIQVEDLKSKHPRITVRLSEFFNDNPLKGTSYSHFRPARYFSENLTALSTALDTETEAR